MSILENTADFVGRAARKALWGVDSYNPATVPVPEEKGDNQYEYIAKRESREPVFYGRYVSIADGNAKALLTKQEIDYLHGKGCKILPFHGRMWVGSVSPKGEEGFENGRRDARAAVNAALALEVPIQVCIYANVEPQWRPTADWMLGWWDFYSGSAYAGGGGFYCGPAAIPAYKKALELAGDRFSWYISIQRPILWITQDTQGAAPGPTMPGNHDSVHGWQYGHMRGKKYFQYDVNVTTPYGLGRMW
jgi:hypothetical protein